MMNDLLTPRGMITILLGIISFLLGILFLTFSYYGDPLLKPFFAGVGGFMLFSVVAPLVYRLTLKKMDDEKRIKEIQDLLEDKIDKCINRAHHYGFRSISDEMDFVGLFDSLNKDDKLWWLDTYPPDHSKFMSNLERAVERGATVNFLVLHPDSPNCEHRALEIGGRYDPKVFKNGILSFWEQLNSSTRSSAQAGEAIPRYYNDLPCMPIYLVTHKDVPQYAYTSFFLNKPTGFGFPHIRWEKGEMLENFYTYVQRKWNANEKNNELK